MPKQINKLFNIKTLTDDPRRSEEDAWGYAVMGRGHQKLVRLGKGSEVQF